MNRLAHLVVVAPPILDREKHHHERHHQREERADGTWIGWLEFEPEDPEDPILVTDQETSQPNRTAVDYWATGLEAVYFEGAFERAHIK